MIQAELQTSYFDTDREEFSWRTLATLTVEDDGSSHGEHKERFGLSKAVVDPDSHERVLFDHDPERWLRLLPTSYRNGDLAVAILHDDHPRHGIAAGGGYAVA